MIDGLKQHYREKRIRRILSFYHNLQTFNWDLGAYQRVNIVSRDARMHFVFTCIFLFLGLKLLAVFHLPFYISLFIAGFIAVELADIILTRGVKIFDIFFDYVVYLAGILIVAGLYFGEKHYGYVSNQIAHFKEFRKRTNDKIQKTAIPNMSDVESGENWILLGYEKGSMHPLTLPEATDLCTRKGPGWKLYDGDFTFHPPLYLKRSQYFWVNGMEGQLYAGEPRKPSGWIMPKPDSRSLGLCVRKP